MRIRNDIGGLRRLLACCAALAASATTLGDPPAASRAPRAVVGMTAPFETATLASVQAARIASIAASEGGIVRRGEIVVQLDERVQTARTEMAKANAETNLNIDHARARWERAQRDLERLQKLHGKDFASTKEMSDALAEEQIARVEYDLAHFNQAQALLAYQREAAMLEEFRLRAPFDAYVVAHLKRPGESVNELEGVISLAQLDPLRVILDCPVEAIATIAEGQRFWVRPADEHLAPRLGTVLLSSRVADGGSQTFRVKLTVENADAAWPAGLKVSVDLSEPADATGSAGNDAKP